MAFFVSHKVRYHPATELYEVRFYMRMAPVKINQRSRRLAHNSCVLCVSSERLLWGLIPVSFVST